MIPGPLFLIIGPAIAALLVYILRRWNSVAVGAGMLAVLILGVTANAIDLEGANSATSGLIAGESWIVLGRTLTLTEQVRTTLLLVYGSFALLFFLSWPVPQGSLFLPINLVVISLVSAALMVRPFVFGALLVLIVAAALAVMIQSERAGSTLASVRYLTMAIIAVPLLMVAGWMVETNQAQFFGPVARLFAATMVILLASFPFHIWVGPTVMEARSLVPVVVFGLIHFVLMVYFLEIMRDNPATLNDRQVLRVMQASGVVTVLVASTMVFIARTFGALLGYLLLFDIGATILSITFGGRAALAETALTLLALRTVGLILAGFGLGLIRRQSGPTGQGFEHLATSSGLAWRTPLGVALFIYGGLSLAGLPLTPGFAGRWALVEVAGTSSPLLAVLLVLAVVAGAIGVLRCLPSLLSETGDEVQPIVPEPVLIRATAGLMLILGVLVAILPQAILSSTGYLAELL